MKELRKITEGMTGYKASEIIWGNDNALGKAIDAVKRQIDANKTYAAIISGGGTTQLIETKQTTGDSTSDVMSQAAVTQELDEIAAVLSAATRIAYSGDIETIGKLTIMSSADVARQAEVDGNNNSIANQFQAINTKLYGVSGITETIAEMQATIAALQKKCEDLEGEKKK